jgi:hypothetical protein
MGWFSRKPPPDPAGTVSSLREHALRVQAEALDVKPTAALPHVWGVIMETAYPEAVATLVVFAEGTTSLYFSNGGGVIGAGAHAPVREAGERLLSTAESHLSKFAPVSGTALPTAGRVSILLRTFTGTLAAHAREEELGAGAHALSEVFFAAHGVITAIRETAPGE